MATREMFFAQRKRKTRTIEAPELGEGVQVVVQRPSARERSEWLQKYCDQDGNIPLNKQLGAAIAIALMACIDDEGKPLFTATDVKTLEDIEPSLLDRIGLAWQWLAKASDVETIAKN